MSRSLKKGPFVESRLLGRVQTMNKKSEKKDEDKKKDE